MTFCFVVSDIFYACQIVSPTRQCDVDICGTFIHVTNSYCVSLNMFKDVCNELFSGAVSAVCSNQGSELFEEKGTGQYTETHRAPRLWRL